jgi:hypothetical protein
MRSFLVNCKLGCFVILVGVGCSDTGGQAVPPGGVDASIVADAKSGGDTIPGQAPVLSSELKSNCYNWPAEDFTTDKFAPWKPSVAAGQLAIDFTLRDVEGKSHTLSQLLIDRPVWIQLGAYT